MARALPKVLVDKIGLDVLLSRLPATYAHSIFSSYLASHFIYSYGIEPSPIEFHYYLTQLGQAAADEEEQAQ